MICSHWMHFVVVTTVGHLDVAEMLVNAGADLSRTMSGKTAHQIAVDFDNLDIADLIEQRTSC